jgi:muramoyltetrapeptide carboxypeptidase
MRISQFTTPLFQHSADIFFMKSSSTPPIKPSALLPGDTVAIIAPASKVRRGDLEAGCDALRRAGYNPTYIESITEKDLYFAGTVDRRLREFEEMFVRDDVKAIVCARGGYGANYLLDRIDLEKIRAHPKIFVGYSDVTALLTFFLDAAGLVTFHGPMAAKDWAHGDGVDMTSWQAALCRSAGWEVGLGADVEPLSEGEGEGILYGGCLSILAASLGTPYEINTEDRILFLEDLGEKPYRIDRMLMQLKLAGKLKGVRGIVFGQMVECVQTPNQGYTLEEVVMRIVGDLEVPVAYGMRSGHVTKENITLPIGVRARLTVRGGSVRLRILEGAVLEV